MPNLNGLFSRLNTNRRSKKSSLLESQASSKTNPVCVMSGSFDSASTTMTACCGKGSVPRKPSKTASLNANSEKLTIEKTITSSLNSLIHLNNDVLIARIPNNRTTVASSSGHGFSFFNQHKSKSAKILLKNSPNSSNICKALNSSHKKLEPYLPEALLLKCIDLLENPFEIYCFRALNLAVRKRCEARLKQIIEMDVRKCAIEENGIDADSPSDSRYWMEGDPQPWFRHPGLGGHKILMRFVAVKIGEEPKRVEILVDECWSSRDVSRLCRILNVFRRPLECIQLDAPIIELIIASLSIMDLDRWYAFQCFMKAVNDYQIHLAINQLEKSQQSIQIDPSELYWPNVNTLIIRTTEKDSVHLARILDYGVRSQLVMDRRRLAVLKIILTDVDKPNRNIIRNLYHFRCWAGSAGFDDRFSQQYYVNAV